MNGWAGHVKSDLPIYKGTVSALHDKCNGGMILKMQLAVPRDQPPCRALP